MSDTVRDSWNAFSESVAAGYLRTEAHGAASLGSKELLVDVLNELGPSPLSILDLGCGNGQLYEYFRGRRFRCRYVGVDFSEPLLEAARRIHRSDQDVRFVADDVQVLTTLVGERFDVVVYSHVLEMLESPELALSRARELAPTVVVRFFEPPANVPDRVELKVMAVDGERSVPYLRRTMSRGLLPAALSQTRVSTGGCLLRRLGRKGPGTRPSLRELGLL